MSKAQQIVLDTIKARGMKVYGLAKRTGEMRQDITQNLKRIRDCRADWFEHMMEGLGYEVRLVDHDCFWVCREYFEDLVENGTEYGLFFTDRPDDMIDFVDTRSGIPETLIFPDRETMWKHVDLVLNDGSLPEEKISKKIG